MAVSALRQIEEATQKMNVQVQFHQRFFTLLRPSISHISLFANWIKITNICLHFLQLSINHFSPIANWFNFTNIFYNFMAEHWPALAVCLPVCSISPTMFYTYMIEHHPLQYVCQLVQFHKQFFMFLQPSISH